MTKKKNFSFCLLVALSMAAVVFNSCGQPASSDKGVVINGVTWAICNVDVPGTFADAPEDAGMFYQWNRRTPWTASEDARPDWDSSLPDGDTWEKANDPSPDGWRLPTFDEIGKLLDTEKVSTVWTSQNGVSGTKFTDKATGNSLFLPAVGILDYSDGRTDYAGTDGFYWSTEPYEDEGVVTLSISSNRTDWNPSYRSFALTIRSVAE